MSPDYPTKDITLIIPWTPGGTAHLSAQAASDGAAPHLGKNAKIVLKNVTGGAGAVGTTEAKGAKPDGYTLVLSSSGAMNAVPHMTNVAYDPLKDFMAIGQIYSTPFIIAVKADAPWKTFKDLVDAGKAKPDTISYGTTGEGGTKHFALLALQKISGTKLKHVPFGGDAETLAAVLGRRVDVGIVEPVNIIQQIRDGKFRGLAVYEPNRLSLAPDIPTAKEQGYDLVCGGWAGIGAPAGTPKEIVAKLEDAYKNSMIERPFKDAMAKMLTPAVYLDAAGFYARWEREYKQFADLAKEFGLVKK